MKELIGIVVGILGLLLCVGGAFNAFISGHYIIAAFWVIGAVFFALLANDALDAVDSDGPHEWL